MSTEAENLRPSCRIYRGELVSVGMFRCHPRHPSFTDSGPTGSNLLVFPRTSVTITYAGREPVVANPNVVMFYNPGQIYRRSQVSERGDHCEWFSFNPDLLIDALRPYYPQVEDHPERPFRLTHAPTDSTSYLLQRLVFEHLLSCEHPDHLFVEETLLRVLGRILRNAFQTQDRRKAEQVSNRDLVHNLKALLTIRFREPLTLESVAAEMHYSPFHLSRIFHQETGSSIHQYLNQLRLRTSLESVVGGAKLTDLAIHLGYSSHSHFTQAFRKEFGSPPSALRQVPLAWAQLQ